MELDMVIADFSSGELMTNYWHTNWATKGVVYGVFNKKTLHLLLPLTKLIDGRTVAETVSEMRTGHKVILYIEENGYDVVFDDGTEKPFGICLHKGAICQGISQKCVGKADLTIMVHLSDGATVEWPMIIPQKRKNMGFIKMVYRDFPANYDWDSAGIICLGNNRDIAAYLSGDCSERCLIFCHGNGESAVSEKPWFDKLCASGITVICPDYRGYGLSDGVFSEEGCYEAVHAAYDFLVNEKGVSQKDIFVLGYSLGSAIAVELAANKTVGGLILQAPFLNGSELKCFWLEKRGMPIMNEEDNSFPTFSRLSSIHVPSLVIHGTEDNVIPCSHGQAIFNRLPSKEKTFVQVNNAGHCNFQIILGEKYILLLLDFILRN